MMKSILEQNRLFKLKNGGYAVGKKLLFAEFQDEFQASARMKELAENMRIWLIDRCIETSPVEISQVNINIGQFVVASITVTGTAA